MTNNSWHPHDIMRQTKFNRNLIVSTKRRKGTVIKFEQGTLLAQVDKYGWKGAVLVGANFGLRLNS